MESFRMHSTHALLLAGILALAGFAPTVATAACHARQAGDAPASADPADRLAQLSEQYWRLEESGALRRHRFTGRSSAALREWMEESRRVVDELAERRRSNPRPALDRSQGFALLLPHLAPMRAETRLRTALIEDAAVRGDAAGLRALLDGTAALAADSARDHILISSLVATAQADAVAGSIDGLLDLGLVDRATAEGMLESTASLAQPTTYAFGEAALGEAEMMRIEFDRLRGLSPEERELWLPEFEGDFSAIGDDDFARADAYQVALAEAVTNPDRDAAKAAVAALDARAAAGEFGDLVKMLAPSFGPAFDRLDRTLARLERQREQLAAIAEGRASATDGANAAAFLLRAADATTSCSSSAQADLEAVRTLGADAPEESLDAARGELRAKLDPIVTALAMAARCTRCDFSSLLPWEAVLVPEETAALAGAVRALLVHGRIARESEAGGSARLRSGVAETTGSRGAEDAAVTGTTDASEVVEAGVVEAGVVEAGVVEAGVVEAGVVEGGIGEGGVVEGGVVVGGIGEGGVVETALESDTTSPAAEQDAVSIALAVLAHLSNGERLAHAIAAQSIARDLADALAHAATDEWTSSVLERRHAAALARVRRDDPFGYRAALAAERTRLARTTIALPAPTGDDPPFHAMAFNPTRVESLAPNQTAFLLAVVSPPSDALPIEACDCAFDGPMLSILPWFDRAALASAREQEPRLRALLAKELAEGRLLTDTAPDRSPLAGFATTTPIDIATRIVEASEDLARLDRLLAPRPTAPAP